MDHSQSNENKHQDHGEHEHHDDHANHHEHMVKDFKRRFFVSLVLTLPLAVMSPMLRSFIGVTDGQFFPGHMLVMLGLATVIFFYGGWPFLKGLFTELKDAKPGMMTLIALAITVAYGYSGLVALGIKGSWQASST